MSDSIAALVTNPIMEKLILTLICMSPSWVAVIIDVEGAFLQGKLNTGEELYIEVPDGFVKWCPGDVVLKMNVSL